jgi:3',5'-cyclic AMP phosphodiesterase CpdA
MNEEFDSPETTLLHCSDLHFGAGFQPDRLERLEFHIAEIKPDAVVVSGDLTMRARPAQFREASDFFRRITCPLLVIPGNHDIPLLNLFRRFIKPFDRYQSAVHHDTDMPTLDLPGVHILGLNTINPARHQQGRVTRHQLEEIERWAQSTPAKNWRLVTIHQHVQNAPGTMRPGRIPNATEVVEHLSRCQIHGLLYGHTHVPFIGCTRKHFPAARNPLLLVNAATITCRRTRGLTKANGFHLLRVSNDRIRITSYEWPQMKRARDFQPLNQDMVFSRDRTLRPTPE